MLVIFLSGADNQGDTVLAFVVKADPGTHNCLVKEVELLIYPLLELGTLQDDLLEVVDRGDELLVRLTFLKFLFRCWSLLCLWPTFLDLLFSANMYIEDTIV